MALAESALNAPAAAYGGVEFYPEPHQKAAVLYSRLVRNHPLPDGNKRVAFICMIESSSATDICLAFSRPMAPSR